MIDVATADTRKILKALRKDKDEVFARIVALYHNGLLAMARAIVGSDDCEEVVQDAWISAYRAIDDFEGRSSLRTWLTRIVINQGRSKLRKGGREFNVDAPADELQAFPERFNEDGAWSTPPREWDCYSPEDLLQEQNLIDCLHKTLQLLPSNQRMALELRDMQGLDLDEICNTLEVTASNVRVLLHRARNRMFNMVDHYQETGEC